MVAESILLASCCVAGIVALFPKTSTYRKSKIKEEWNKIMTATGTKNDLGETFEVKNLDIYENNSFNLKAKIPAGLAPENLIKLEKNFEYSFGGDITIDWDKYDGHILVKVNRDPVILKQNIKRKWTAIFSSKEINNKFKQYFDIRDIALNTNSSYILTVTTPITLSEDSLASFRKLIESNLINETLESFHKESNNIFITVSHKSEKDSR
jgi:hypothetical protein